jgi:hypothetical protein
VASFTAADPFPLKLVVESKIFNYTVNRIVQFTACTIRKASYEDRIVSIGTQVDNRLKMSNDRYTVDGPWIWFSTPLIRRHKGASILM